MVQRERLIMDTACVACGESLCGKRKYEKQKLCSLDGVLIDVLGELFKEVGGSSVDTHSLEEKGAVICRACKSSLNTYSASRLSVLGKIKKGLSLVQSYIPGIAPSTPSGGNNTMAAGTKRGGLGTVGSSGPKRLYVNNEGKSPPVLVKDDFENVMKLILLDAALYFLNKG